jgi:hypothetical protein
MAAVLAVKGSPLAWLYAAASCVAFLYHVHRERAFVAADHALAWACIAANLWLAWHGESALVTVTATAVIGLALHQYREAHRGDYDMHHTVWHWWCGLAGLLLASNYTA